MRRLIEGRRFQEIAEGYRKGAYKKRNEVGRLNFLGLASLYDHDAQSAIHYFTKSLNRIVGKSENTIRRNLTNAYLQAGRYQDACELLDQLRQSGQQNILDYVFALLVNGQREEAREFYQTGPLKYEDASMKILLDFDPQEPETLEAAHQVVDDPYLWLYQRVLYDLFDLWDLEVFFHRNDRYQVLSQQCNKLIEWLTGDLFSSANVRYMRGLLVSVRRKIQEERGFTQLYGLFHGLDKFVSDLPVSEEIRHECIVFWRRIYYFINNMFNPHHFQLDQAEEWIIAQLPSEAKRYSTQSSRCELYLLPSLQRGVRILRQFESSPQVYAELISQDDVQKTWVQIRPFVEILAKDPSLDYILEPLIFSLVYDVHDVSEETIHKAIIRLPDKFRTVLEEPRMTL